MPDLEIGLFKIKFYSHVCFQFFSPNGRSVITDPFWGNGFMLEDHFEKYLSPPDIPIDDIKQCDVVFVSHVHGDHFDPDALFKLHRQTQCQLLVPADVFDVLSDMGFDPEVMLSAEEDKAYRFDDLCLNTYCRYDDSFDNKGRPDKFSLIIQSAQTRLFYSGDCHELPPGIIGAEVDAMFCWPHPDDGKMKSLCQRLNTNKFVLMHTDRFEPGDFICNADLLKEKDRIENMVPGMQVMLPSRAI